MVLLLGNYTKTLKSDNPIWLIRFVDGSEQFYAAETIAQAIDECELVTGKFVRSAMYQPEVHTQNEQISAGLVESTT